jgi:hypothetical protein
MAAAVMVSLALGIAAGQQLVLRLSATLVDSKERRCGFELLRWSTDTERAPLLAALSTPPAGTTRGGTAGARRAVSGRPGPEWSRRTGRWTSGTLPRTPAPGTRNRRQKPKVAAPGAVVMDAPGGGRGGAARGGGRTRRRCGRAAGSSPEPLPGSARP